MNGRFDESRRWGWQVSDHCQRRDSGDVVTGPWHPIGFLRGPLSPACLVSETECFVLIRDPRVHHDEITYEGRVLSLAVYAARTQFCADARARVSIRAGDIETCIMGVGDEEIEN